MQQMTFFQVFLIFFLLSSLSILWPLLRGWRDDKRQLRQDVRSELSGAVLEDHAKELEETRAIGDISDTELRSLKRDLKNTIAAEQSTGTRESARAIIFGRKSRLSLFAITLILPIAVFVFYLQVGAKADWAIAQESKALFQAEQVSREESLALIQKVKARLDTTPENGHLLFLLGNLSNRIGDFEGAVIAYRELNEIFPDDTTVLSQLAQALYLRSGNVITPEVREATKQVLELDPQQPDALGFAGIDAFQNGRYDEAISYWQLAVKQLDPNSAASQFLTRGIASAKISLEKAGGNTVAQLTEAGTRAEIKVAVSLGSNVNDLTGEEAVFVYARAWQGAKMPLAIQRLTVGDLPTTVTLTKDQAMAQGMDITSSPQLEVIARVSKTGSPSPQPGDWAANFGPVLLGSDSASLALEISQMVR